MASQAVELRTLPPYTALLWKEFQSCPQLMYNLFESTVRPGNVSHTSDKVFDMSGAMISHQLSELTVKNVEELHKITNDLLNMPILFRIKVEHQRTDHYVAVRIRKKWKDEFAVLVNTRHPQIRELMTNQLTKAMQYMQEGKNFCLKFDFGPSVRQWYSSTVDGEVSLCDSRSNNDSGHMELWVTNYSTPMECCMSPVCILVCFPFWLGCGGPCYLAHRKIKCDDFKQEIKDLPVTMLTGVNVMITTTGSVPSQVPQHMPHPTVPAGQQMSYATPQANYESTPQTSYAPPQGPDQGMAPPAYSEVDPRRQGYNQ